MSATAVTSSSSMVLTTITPSVAGSSSSNASASTTSTSTSARKISASEAVAIITLSKAGARQNPKGVSNTSVNTSSTSVSRAPANTAALFQAVAHAQSIEAKTQKSSKPIMMQQRKIVPASSTQHQRQQQQQQQYQVVKVEGVNSTTSQHLLSGMHVPISTMTPMTMTMPMPTSSAASGNTVLYMQNSGGEHPEELVETVETTEEEVEWNVGGENEQMKQLLQLVNVETEQRKQKNKGQIMRVIDDEREELRRRIAAGDSNSQSSGEDTREEEEGMSQQHVVTTHQQYSEKNIGIASDILTKLATHYSKSRSVPNQVKEENVEFVEEEKMEFVEEYTIVEPTSPEQSQKQTVEHMGQTLVLHDTQPSARKARIQLSTDQTTSKPYAHTIMIKQVGENSYVDANTGEVLEFHDSQFFSNEENTQNIAASSSPSSSITVQHQNNSFNQDDFRPCPICGDKISGYHYGTYTCESCKGFFKRTVQNKKSFICHRKGECEISLNNRKKCPACRFKQCLDAGMRLEAIRTDRQRGGRSSYDGCSPHGRPKMGASRSSMGGGNKSLLAPRPAQQQQAVKNEKANTSSATQVLQQQSMPRTPQILDDLTAIESLMSEDDNSRGEPQECCVGKLGPDDPDMFGSLLHFADHCLYKIVRWARNLPDFAGVSTDDQILLLQNCWGELLVITCCWQSMHAPSSHLRLCHGRTLSLDEAEQMGMRELISRLIDFAGHMQHLAVDLHEFVALKVLMLLTPDVRNLHEEHKIRAQQEKISDALMIYTTTHYPDAPNKYCELLARLAELARTVVLGKEFLRERQAHGDIPAASLLSELLKGDAQVMSG